LQIFSTHLSHLAPLFGVTPFEFTKSFTVLETRVFQAAENKDDPSLHRLRLIHPCDGQTDGRTDRIAMAKTS